MNCTDVKTDLSAYLDDEVTAAVRAEIEAHVAQCASCRQELAELKRLMAGVAALPQAEPALRFLAEVRRKLAGPEPRAAWWMPVLVPAGALAVVALAFLMTARMQSPAPRQDSATNYRTLKNHESNAPASPVPAEESALAKSDAKTAGPVAARLDADGALKKAEVGFADAAAGRQTVTERIVMRAASVEEAQRRVMSLVTTMKGQAGEKLQEKRGEVAGARSFFVQVPAGQVAMLRTQLTALENEKPLDQAQKALPAASAPPMPANVSTLARSEMKSATSKEGADDFRAGERDKLMTESRANVAGNEVADRARPGLRSAGAGQALGGAASGMILKDEEAALVEVEIVVEVTEK